MALKNKKIFKKIILFILPFSIIGIYFSYVKTADAGGDIVWEQIEDPQPGIHTMDFATKVVPGESSSYIYVLGNNAWDVQEFFRVEKRNSSDGSLVWYYDEPTTYYNAGSIAYVGGYIYVVGISTDPNTTSNNFEIVKLNTSGGLVSSTSGGYVPATQGDFYGIYQAYVDSTGVYLTGVDSVGSGDDNYGILCRYSLTGVLQWNREYIGSGTIGQSSDPFQIITDGVSYVYYSGFFHRASAPLHDNVISKRNISDGNVATPDFFFGSDCGSRNVLALDSSYLYNSCGTTIQRRNLSNLSLVNSVATSLSAIYAMTVKAGDGIFVVGGTTNSSLAKISMDLSTTYWSTGKMANNFDIYDYSTAYNIMVDSGGVYTGGHINGLNEGDSWDIVKSTITNSAPGAGTPCGLRYWDGTSAVNIACKNPADNTTALRMYKGGVTYGIELVNRGDANASKIYIQTTGGMKALKKAP